MSTPRKFSEKIALHLQKQQEEKLAFEQIMREVTETVAKPIPTPPINSTKLPQTTHLLPVNLPNFGGSLPNVNSINSINKGFHQGSGRSSHSSRHALGPGPVRGDRKHRTDHSPYASPPSMSHSMSSNPGVNIGSPELNFGSNYLSPPSEPNWRRANSDSALNSLNNSLMIPSVVPDLSTSEESSNNSNDPRENSYGLSVGNKDHLTPNTSTIGDGPSLLEIPPPASTISTGSLPDLSNFQFPPPLQQPIDMEEQQLNHSPYSTVRTSLSLGHFHSPLTGSSLTYSPTSLSPQNHQGGGGGNQSQQQHQQSPVQRTPQSPHSPQQQQQPILENPLHVNTSFQNFSPNDNMLAAYRCPTRPSPQNSPSPFRSASPLDHLSAPPSPTNQQTQQTSANQYYLSQQAQALQQHFEQISMMDASPRNGGHWRQGGGMANSSPYFPYSQSQQQQIPTGATAGVTTQQSPLDQPQTPQTPSSIPDIIFTEFLGEDFLSSDAAAALRSDLGPIDINLIEMLRDSTLIPLDSNVEDSFRLDRL